MFQPSCLGSSPSLPWVLAPGSGCSCTPSPSSHFTGRMGRSLYSHCASLVSSASMWGRCGRHPASPVMGPPTQTSPLLWEHQLEGKRMKNVYFSMLLKLQAQSRQENESKEGSQCLRLQIVFWPFFSDLHNSVYLRQSDHGSGPAFYVHCTHFSWAVWFDTWQQSNSGDQTSPQTLCSVTSNVYWHSKVHSGNVSGWAGTQPPCSARDSLNHRLQLPTKIKPKFK